MTLLHLKDDTMSIVAHDLRSPAARMDMGATVELGGVRFRVWAPAATSVDADLAGCLVALQKAEDGTWSGFVEGIGAGARYRFRLNGEGSFPDPYSRSQPEGPHGSSEVVDPDAFAWHDQSWRRPDIRGQAIYQLHIGTFT